MKEIVSNRALPDCGKTMKCKARESRAKGAYCSYMTERKTKRNTAVRVFPQSGFTIA